MEEGTSLLKARTHEGKAKILKSPFFGFFECAEVSIKFLKRPRGFLMTSQKVPHFLFV